MIFAVSFFSWPPFSGSVMTCVSPALILSSFLSRIDLDGDVDQAKRDGAFPQRARHFQALLSNAVERCRTRIDGRRNGAGGAISIRGVAL